MKRDAQKDLEMFKEKWFAEKCPSEKPCWCKRITKVPGSFEDKDVIVPGGSVRKEYADQIVESREALPYWIKRGRGGESWLKHILNNYDMDPVDALMIRKFLEGEEIGEDEAERIVGGGQG